jgi:hypothetical protein
VQRALHLVVGGLGGAQLVAGLLELAAQRVLVELGGAQLVELGLGGVDGPGGGVALLLHQGEAVAGVLHLGATVLEGALGLVRGLRELARLVQQRVAFGQVGGQAAGSRGGLVAAVGGDRLLLAGPAKFGG